MGLGEVAAQPNRWWRGPREVVARHAVEGTRRRSRVVQRSGRWPLLPSCAPSLPRALRLLDPPPHFPSPPRQRACRKDAQELSAPHPRLLVPPLPLLPGAIGSYGLLRHRRFDRSTYIFLIVCCLHAAMIDFM